MNTTRWLCLLVALCCNAQAQNTLKTIPQAAQVQTNADAPLYEELERSLEQALSSQNSQEVLAKLSADFVARDARQAGVLTRQAWLDQARIRRAARLVSDLHVQLNTESKTAVVSFYLLEPASDKRPARTTFVVDVWRQQQLMSRYTSPVRQIPSARRPDGKE